MPSYSYLVSVCITSYKRVRELERCLKSIDSKRTDTIEVVVSEDCSPQRKEIRKVVVDYAERSPYHVVFNTNEQNLGYDRNLKMLATLASGEYVLYLSDDDWKAVLQALEEVSPEYRDAADEVFCRYDYEWSIGNGNEAEHEAAERLLSWMLGNSYQNLLMISRSSDGQIPINHECFDAKLEQKNYSAIKNIYSKYILKK